MSRQKVAKHIFEVGPIVSLTYMNRLFGIEFWYLPDEKSRSGFTNGHENVQFAIFDLKLLENMYIWERFVFIGLFSSLCRKKSLIFIKRSQIESMFKFKQHYM